MKNSSFSASRLKEERKKLGLTQIEIAEKTGISARMWRDYENEVSQPKAETLFRLKQAGINVDYVMGSSESPSDGLSPEERELLAMFRAASGLGRAVILSAARGAEKKETASAADKVA